MASSGVFRIGQCLGLAYDIAEIEELLVAFPEVTDFLS